MAVADLDLGSAEHTATELDAYGTDHLAVRMDVTERASVDDAVAAVVAQADGRRPVAVAGGDVLHSASRTPTTTCGGRCSS